MKVFLVALLAVVVIDPTRIARINAAKTEARKAYVAADYKKAASLYQYLSDSLEVKEDEVTLNLANSFYHVKDTANAMSRYQSLTASTKDHIRSKAYQQLGIMLHQQGKFEEALTNFKESIKADNNNIDAKYNYEALKKKLEEEKKKQEEKEKNRPKEPSAYAKRLKAQADKLAAGFRFPEAEKLMSDGAKKDPSVLYYEDFINRLKEIVTIDKQ
jgi:tetratricopeptide (TPR) repeat protein